MLHKSYVSEVVDPLSDHLDGSTLVVIDTIDMVEGVCNGFLPYTRFLGFLEFSGYHQWQQESQ